MSEEFEKRMLIDGLEKQAQLMRFNAKQLEKWYGEYSNHVELLGAAKLTDDWAASIRNELGKKEDTSSST